MAFIVSNLIAVGAALAATSIGVIPALLIKWLVPSGTETD